MLWGSPGAHLLPLQIQGARVEAVTGKLGRGGCWLKIRLILQVAMGGTRLSHVFTRPMLPGWWRLFRLDPQRASRPSHRSSKWMGLPGKAGPLHKGLLFAEAAVLALLLVALEKTETP